MIRRKFIKLAALTGATGLASLGVGEALREEDLTASARDLRTVTLHVRGFTCVTCAVGLETMLRREKGVAAAKATYPQGMVTIQYHPGLLSEDALRSMITELGFTADAKGGWN